MGLCDHCRAVTLTPTVMLDAELNLDTVVQLAVLYCIYRITGLMY